MDPDPHSSTWDDFVGAALLSGWDEPLVSMPWEQGFAGMVLGGEGLTAPMATPRPGQRRRWLLPAAAPLRLSRLAGVVLGGKGCQHRWLCRAEGRRGQGAWFGVPRGRLWMQDL